MQSADLGKLAMALAVTAGFFGILTMMALCGSTMALGEAGLVLMGYLGASFNNVIGYYFGSSAGSAAKDALLRKGEQK